MRSAQAEKKDDISSCTSEMGGVANEGGYEGLKDPSVTASPHKRTRGLAHWGNTSGCGSLKYTLRCVVCVFSSHPFWTSMDVPAGVTQEEGHTGFLIHLPPAVRALIFVARRIQPFLSLVDREVEFCALTN